MIPELEKVGVYLPSRAGMRGPSGKINCEDGRVVVALEHINGGVGRLDRGT